MFTERCVTGLRAFRTEPLPDMNVHENISSVWDRDLAEDETLQMF
jgi:hypothetical protein